MVSFQASRKTGDDIQINSFANFCETFKFINYEFCINFFSNPLFFIEYSEVRISFFSNPLNLLLNYNEICHNYCSGSFSQSNKDSILVDVRELDLTVFSFLNFKL